MQVLTVTEPFAVAAVALDGTPPPPDSIMAPPFVLVALWEILASLGPP